jgi:myosin heavy subunit
MEMNLLFAITLGDVTYSADGMCDKNKDNLFYDHMDLACSSASHLVASLFPEALNKERDKKTSFYCWLQN